MFISIRLAYSPREISVLPWSIGGQKLCGTYTGDKSPLIAFDAVQHVVSLQADGDELEAIRAMRGIVVPDRSVVRWFGTDAQFIAANL